MEIDNDIELDIRVIQTRIGDFTIYVQCISSRMFGSTRNNYLYQRWTGADAVTIPLRQKKQNQFVDPRYATQSIAYTLLTHIY